MNNLPNWNGWTVDIRLRQFRKVEDVAGEPYIHMHDFNSHEGHILFETYCEEQIAYHQEECSCYEGLRLDIENDTFSEEDEDILANEIYHGAHGEKGK